jgi:hypothetical protein
MNKFGLLGKDWIPEVLSIFLFLLQPFERPLYFFHRLAFVIQYCVYGFPKREVDF